MSSELFAGTSADYDSGLSENETNIDVQATSFNGKLTESDSFLNSFQLDMSWVFCYFE